jgi:curved DNA-binding protein CbpA
MSTTDPKGYYACLGVEPWATADQIRTAYHRCAKLYHPDHNPSPQAKARFQAISEAYRTLGNPQQRAAYDNARRASAPDKTDHGPVLWWRTELDPGSRALSTRKLAQVVGVGALGFALLALLFVVAVGPYGSDLLPGTSPPVSSASATLPELEVQGLPFEQALQPTKAHSALAGLVASNPASSIASVPPRPASTQNNSLSGAWLLRDLLNPKPALNLLAREEAARLQEQLVERGYLIGPADGVWGPRSHAALEDFRRAQGLDPDDGWTKKETHTALGSERSQEAGPPAIAEARALVQEEAVPPPRPLALHSRPDVQAVSNLPLDGGDTAPEPRPAVHVGPAGAEETIEGTYVGAWARARADCFQETDAPPLAISAQRAESFGGAQGTCEFVQVQREGAGWRTRARCSANGKSWTSHVQLKVTSSTLVWSSERGRATYYRCPPRVSATE